MIGFELLDSQCGGLQCRRCQRFEKGVRNGLVEGETAHVKAVDAPARLDFLLITIVAGRSIGAL